jgi:hypothetical protein
MYGLTITPLIPASVFCNWNPIVNIWYDVGMMAPSMMEDS